MFVRQVALVAETNDVSASELTRVAAALQKQAIRDFAPLWDISATVDPFVTLVEIHKLMYFLQEAGESLRLNYKQHHYGPYAENLKHVLQHLLNRSHSRNFERIAASTLEFNKGPSNKIKQLYIIIKNYVNVKSSNN